MRLYDKCALNQKDKNENESLLKKILKTIFGPTEGDSIFFTYIQNRNLFQQKKKQNETFTFNNAKNKETINIKSNILINLKNKNLKINPSSIS